MRNNYLYVEKYSPREVFTSLAKNIEINVDNSGSPVYRIYGLRDWESNNSIHLSQILKEDGTNYSLNEWETFYTTNTGKTNASGGSITESDPQFSASEASLFVSGDKGKLDSFINEDYYNLPKTFNISSINTITSKKIRISANFDLGGGTITLPNNVDLIFEGGTFTNGSITGTGYNIVARRENIFKNGSVTLLGTPINSFFS